MCLPPPPASPAKTAIGSAHTTDLVARGPHNRVVRRVDARHDVGEDRLTAVDHHAVFLDTLQPPPDSVATVVAGVRSPAE